MEQEKCTWKRREGILQSQNGGRVFLLLNIYTRIYRRLISFFRGVRVLMLLVLQSDDRPYDLRAVLAYKEIAAHCTHHRHWATSSKQRWPVLRSRVAEVKLISPTYQNWNIHKQLSNRYTPTYTLEDGLHAAERTPDVDSRLLYAPSCLTTPTMADAASVLTPPDSAVSPSASAASGIASFSAVLPPPRNHPLAPGSTKEIKLIHYLDDQLLRVYRRYEKRLPQGQRAGVAQDDAPGYENMEEVIADLDPLVDVVWITHTRKSTSLP